MTETADEPRADLASGNPRGALLAVIVAALGYFVDIYDLVLFGVIREKSLVGIGITAKEELTDKGVHLVNMQMIGMLIGGILWGILGDKRGRLSVLFGSILLYSVANIANGMVHDVGTYAALRFVAGVGLAGELGAGVTLVTESMSRTGRGYGTTIVAAIGILGAVVAVLIGTKFENVTILGWHPAASAGGGWRLAYYAGGGLGLMLLLLRIGVAESLLFKGVAAKSTVSRGNFFALFTEPRRALRYVCIVLSGVPIWYAVGILYIFAPEIGESMGLAPRPSAGDAILYGYIGLAAGDLASGAFSQIVRSRKRALYVFVILSALSVVGYFVFGAHGLGAFRWLCFAVGVGTGYWAIFVTMASEQFGTNLRATATTTAPNFVRGAVVPLTAIFNALRKGSDAKHAAMWVGAGVLALAFGSLFALEETYGKDLDFVEH